MFVGIALLLALAAVLLAALAQEEQPPDQVLAKFTGFFPEGIEWDAESERFLLGSLTLGTICEVADDGTTQPFIEDEDLKNSVGIHIDVERNRLLVASGDPTAFFDTQFRDMRR